MNRPGVHTPQANYSHVTRVGNTLYISGQLSLDPDGNLVGAGDAEAQAEQCYRNIKAIVEHFGGSMEDVVKITQYITDLAYRPLVARPRDCYLGTPGQYAGRHQGARDARVPGRDRGNRHPGVAVRKRHEAFAAPPPPISRTVCTSAPRDR